MKTRSVEHYIGLDWFWQDTCRQQKCGFTANWSDHRVSKCHWTFCCDQSWETLWDFWCCASTVSAQAAECAVYGKGSWSLQRMICRGFHACHAGCLVQWLASPHCKTGLGTLPFVHSAASAPVACSAAHSGPCATLDMHIYSMMEWLNTMLYGRDVCGVNMYQPSIASWGSTDATML